MSEAEGKVRIEYEVETDEAVAAQERLERAVDAYEEQLLSTSSVAETHAQALDTATAATDSLSAAAVESGFKLAEMRERASSAVGALGTLSSVLGTESAAGSVVGRMSHFGQLGTQIGGIFGPEGAVVGAVGGAAVGAIMSFYDALTPVLPQIESVGAAALVAASDIDAMGASAQSAGDRMREFVDSMSRTNQARGLADINAQITEASDRIAALRDGGSAFDRLEIPALSEQLAQLVQRSQEASAEVDANTGPARRRSSGRERPEFDEARYLSEFRMGLIDEQEAREMLRLQRVAEEEQHLLEARKGAVEMAEREADEQARKRLEDQARAASEAMEREESKRLQIKRRQESDTRMWRGTQESMLDATLGGANAIGGAFADAFGAAIQGQEDFGTAFVKGAKQQLLQFGIGQVAEGAGALLSAVGFLFTNPPAAAGKAVEGAGKIALGVSLGAAGAAISVPAPAAGGEDRAPRMGPSSTEGGGGGNVIVNMNSPLVTAGTEAQLGRNLSRTISGSARRFGRAA